MPRIPLEAYAFDARFGKRSVSILDPRLVVGSGDDILLDPVPTGYLNARIRPGGPNRSLHDQNFPSVS